MKVLVISFFFTSVVAIGDLSTTYDLQSEIDSAKGRFENDFLLGVWYRSNEAIVESREKLLKLYTHYTIQQAEQVVEHITKYRNFTRVESAEKRDKALATKNTTRIMELVDCIFKGEDNTVQAYKMTGYNLHNCIRMAQIQTETRYQEILKNFEHIKNNSLQMHDYYSKKIENCLDKMCVLTSLIQSVIHYEKLQEDIATNVTEINGLNTRYLLNHIALGCVSNSIIQLENNYNIGKGLVDDCFLPRNETQELPKNGNERPELPKNGNERTEFSKNGNEKLNNQNSQNENISTQSILNQDVNVNN